MDFFYKIFNISLQKISEIVCLWQKKIQRPAAFISFYYLRILGFPEQYEDI